jgi:hypothetical protein
MDCACPRDRQRTGANRDRPSPGAAGPMGVQQRTVGRAPGRIAALVTLVGGGLSSDQACRQRARVLWGNGPGNRACGCQVCSAAEGPGGEIAGSLALCRGVRGPCGGRLLRGPRPYPAERGWDVGAIPEQTWEADLGQRLVRTGSGRQAQLQRERINALRPPWRILAHTWARAPTSSRSPSGVRAVRAGRGTMLDARPGLRHTRVQRGDSPRRARVGRGSRLGGEHGEVEPPLELGPVDALGRRVETVVRSFVRATTSIRRDAV